MATLLLLYCRWCFTGIYVDPNCSQHVTAALLAVYLEPLTCSCTLQSQLICSVVITLCIRLLFTVKRWGVHACRTTCACSASYMQYVHHRVWPWPLYTHARTSSCILRDQWGWMQVSGGTTDCSETRYRLLLVVLLLSPLSGRVFVCGLNFGPMPVCMAKALGNVRVEVIYPPCLVWHAVCRVQWSSISYTYIYEYT